MVHNAFVQRTLKSVSLTKRDSTFAVPVFLHRNNLLKVVNKIKYIKGFKKDYNKRIRRNDTRKKAYEDRKC